MHSDEDYRRLRLAHYLVRARAGSLFDQLTQESRSALSESHPAFDEGSIEVLLGQAPDLEEVVAALTSDTDLLSESAIHGAEAKASAVPLQSAEFVLAIGGSVALIVLSLRVGSIEKTANGIRFKFFENNEKLSASLEAALKLLKVFWLGTSKGAGTEDDNG